MKLNKLASSLVFGAALGLASVAANASTYSIGDTYNAAPGGIDTNLGTIAQDSSNNTFGGKLTATDLGSDSVVFTLPAFGGLTTAFDTSYQVAAGVQTNLSLWKLSSGSIYDFLKNGTFLGVGPSSNANNWTVGALLNPGTYLLRLDAPVGTNYSGTVSAVPLPAAALLFGSTLLGAGALRRKQNAIDMAAA